MSRQLKCMVLLVLMLLLSSCKGKAADVTIDSSGGSAKMADAVEFVFPANSVDSAVQVAVDVESPKGVTLPEGGNSDLYSLEVNAKVSTPITVRVKLKDASKSESNLIGLGSVVTNSFGEEELDFRYIDATLDGDYAVGTFIPSEYSSDVEALTASLSLEGLFGVYAEEKKAPKTFKTYVGVFTCAAYYNEGGHFKVYYPGVARFTEGQQLVDDLETYYNLMLENGYSYSQRTSWPFEVYIKSIGNEAEYCENGWFGRNVNYGYININKKHWITGYARDTVRPLLVHEWFHFVQANYTVGGTDSSWFDEATSTAYETKVAQATPSIVNEYGEKMWQGVFPETDTPQEGYARAPIIEFLAQKYNDRNFMLDALQRMSTGEDAASAIFEATGDPIDWVQDCYRSLTMGDFGPQKPFLIYKYVLSQDSVYSTFGSVLTMIVPEADVIEKAAEEGTPVPLGQGTCSIKPYGAHFFAIQMTEEEQKKLGDGMTLMLSTGEEDPCTIDAYILDSRNKPTLVPGGESGIMVKDVRTALSRGDKILILLTNLTPSTIDVTLESELVMFPTLDELVGEYKDGKMIFDKVYFSDAIIQEATEKAANASDDDLDFSGCDLDMINAMKALEGQERPATLKIDKTGKDSGILSVVVYNEGEASDPLLMDFTYLGGIISINMFDSDSESTLEGEIKAVYGKNADVLVDGVIRVTGKEKQDEAYIDLRFKGSKPIIPIQ